MTALDAYEFVDMDHELRCSERLLELGLLDGVSYRTGDQLAVLPNPGRPRSAGC